MIQVYDKYGKIKSSGLPGSGTVTSFSAGNFSPLFNSTVTSPTSTPNISFSSISQAQNLFYASPNGSSGVPTFRALVAADIPTLTNYVPTSRTLTINGVTYDLSADRSWTVTAPGGSGIPHATAAGTDTYTATVTGVTAYADGDAYLIRFTNGNTTGCTLNINSLGAIPLYRNNDGPLLGGDIVDGAEMLCVYNSTSVHFQVIGVAPNTLIAYVTNDDSVTITKGQAVYAFSGTGDRMTVKRASNTGDATSAQTVGLVLSTSIAANQKGLIMMQGLLDGLNILPTATWSDGDPVYLGATPGSITKVKPYAPNHLVYLGVVTTASNGSAGRMYVKVQNGYELDELHNVQAQSPSVNDVLYYFGGSPGQWKTASISTVLGYTPGTVTSVAALTLGTTGTDLSSTVATGTTTPVITLNVPTASATNRGALSSTDWSTFNNKQNNLKTFNTTQGIYYFEEFMGAINNTIVSAYNSVVSLLSGNGSITMNNVATTNRTNQQGVITHSTGTASTNYAGYNYGVNSLYRGTGAITLESYIIIPTLSTSGERFVTVFGEQNGANFMSPTNSISIVYDEGGVFLASGVASNNWRCFTRAGSTITRTDTTVPVVANQWYKLRINISADGLTITFFIDNVLVATHNTNVPLISTQLTVASYIMKSVGTTARTMQTDYFMYEEIFTNPR